ncbi:MAG: biotin-dependent carboxyltransferase family protein [Ekhidna sp.]
MGKLRVIKASGLSTVQDKGRDGYRQFGIPQSGAMDLKSMKEANYLVGNPKEHPVIEFALSGMKLEALEDTIIGVAGANVNWNGKLIEQTTIQLTKGDMVDISSPRKVYGYLGIGGMMKTKNDFGSYSTYLTAGFGGIDGRPLMKEDVLETIDAIPSEKRTISVVDDVEVIQSIRIEKGPEWNLLQESPEDKIFKVEPSSNRIGIRLSGTTISCDGSEITSSAVIPGTIQLPPNGEPIILMNDCQTTGGYPRIGKVVDEDMGKLSQVPHMNQVELVLI